MMFVDISKAYRRVKVRYKDIFIQGFMIDGHIFVDLFISFGTSAACREFSIIPRAFLEGLFEREPSFLEKRTPANMPEAFGLKRLRKKQIRKFTPKIILGELCLGLSPFVNAREVLYTQLITGSTARSADSIIDDIWTGDRTSQGCTEKLEKILHHGEELGIDWKHAKTVWTSVILVIMGFVCHLGEKWMSLPDEKIEKIIGKIDHILENTVSLKHLQSLLGSLNWFAMLKPHTRILHHTLISDLALEEPITVSSATRIDLSKMKRIL